MKLFIQDYGVYGCIVVVASSEEKAHEFMNNVRSLYSYYDPDQPFEEHEIKEGFIFENLGDR